MNLAIRSSRAALGVLLVVLVLGCDKKSKPTGPEPPVNPSLETLWPHEDGRTWNYRATARQWDDVGARIYQTRDSVPPVPPLSQIAGLLGTQPIGSNPASDTATFQLMFQGQMTTGSGVTAQYLREAVLRPGPLAAAGFRARASSPRSVATAMPSEGFLRDLLVARPDLARRLAPSEGLLATPDTLIHERATLFLFGYAWKGTSEWIGSYGDVDTALAWIYLRKNLTPGSGFIHQLVPSLASDVFLHGRILNRATLQTPAGTFQDAVVCLYSVDYGISARTDQQGNLLGYTRHYSYGTVTYADSVGPVASYERRLVGLGRPSLGNYDLNLALSSRSGPAPLASRR